MCIIPGITDTKYAFRQHLLSLGFESDMPSDIAKHRLVESFGEERAREFDALSTRAVTDGAAGQNAIYDFVQTFQEANLLRSINTGVTLETSYFLYEKARPFLTPGTTVVELGCWTGGLSSFIAEQHPNCRVVGVDRADHVLTMNRCLYKLQNLTFHKWDYRLERPQEVSRGNVLVCGLGTNYDCQPDSFLSLNANDVRASSGYMIEFAEALEYFVNWRQAAHSGARLFAVLKAGTFPRFLAFIDAAQAGGWTPVLEDFAVVACPSHQDRIPFFSFIAENGRPLSEDAILSCFLFLQQDAALPTIAGPAALAMYRSLACRTVLATKEVTQTSGRTAVQELRIAGSFAYVYTWNSVADFHLVLLPVWRIDQIRRVFLSPPSPKSHGES